MGDKANPPKHTLLGLSTHRVGFVGLLDNVTTLLVSLSELLGLVDHALNVLLAQTGR
jgi:hypothetical protein